MTRKQNSPNWDKFQASDTLIGSSQGLMRCLYIISHLLFDLSSSDLMGLDRGRRTPPIR